MIVFICRHPQGPTKGASHVWSTRSIEARTFEQISGQQLNSFSSLWYNHQMCLIEYRTSHCRKNTRSKSSSNVEHPIHNSQSRTTEHRTIDIFHCFVEYGSTTPKTRNCGWTRDHNWCMHVWGLVCCDATKTLRIPSFSWCNLCFSLRDP